MDVLIEDISENKYPDFDNGTIYQVIISFFFEKLYLSPIP